MELLRPAASGRSSSTGSTRSSCSARSTGSSCARSRLLLDPQRGVCVRSGSRSSHRTRPSTARRAGLPARVRCAAAEPDDPAAGGEPAVPDAARRLGRAQTGSRSTWRTTGCTSRSNMEHLEPRRRKRAGSRLTATSIGVNELGTKRQARRARRARPAARRCRPGSPKSWPRTYHASGIRPSRLADGARRRPPRPCHRHRRPNSSLLPGAAMLERGWDLAIIVTDLPFRLGGRPVSRHVSRTHGVALVSLPALGLLHLKQRLRRALSEIAGDLIGAAGSLREIAAEADDHVSGVLYAPTVIVGHPTSSGRDGARSPAVAFRGEVSTTSSPRPWPRVRYGDPSPPISGGSRLPLAGGDSPPLCLVSLTVTIVVVIGGARALGARAATSHVRAEVLLFNVMTATHRHDRDPPRSTPRC